MEGCSHSCASLPTSATRHSRLRDCTWGGCEAARRGETPSLHRSTRAQRFASRPRRTHREPCRARLAEKGQVILGGRRPFPGVAAKAPSSSKPAWGGGCCSGRLLRAQQEPPVATGRIL